MPIAYKGMDVNRVRLILNDANGVAMTDKRKTLDQYSKSIIDCSVAQVLKVNT
jgi:hypothetical protein